MGKSYAPPVRIIESMRPLVCALHPDECHAALFEASKVQREFRDADAEFERYRKAHIARQASRRAEIARLLDRSRSASEVREVAVQERHSIACGEVFVVRLDTTDLIERRAMTPEEREWFDQQGDERDGVTNSEG